MTSSMEQQPATSSLMHDDRDTAVKVVPWQNARSEKEAAR
jgi:hypothetical protein